MISLFRTSANRISGNPTPGNKDNGLTYTLRCGWKSLAGHYREANEDRCFADAANGIFLVADGIGGHCGGASASQIVAETVPRCLQKIARSPFIDITTMQAVVDVAIDAARREMINFAEQHPECCRMGATMALGAVAGGSFYFTHAGDSRIYHLQQGTIRRLTADETFVQALVEAGVVSKEDAHFHPRRHCVLNYVGVKPPDHQLKVFTIALEPNDRIVLTTDGLTDVLDDETLHQVVMSHQDPQSAADALANAALQLDSKDNVSCVVVEIANAQMVDSVDD